MLIHQGDDRSSDLDRRLACTLAAIAGALNTAAFHAVGFFSANMTGNVSLVSDHVALGDILTSLFYLSIVVAFIAGAAVSTLLANAGRRRSIQAIYAISILLEGLLLGLLGTAVVLLPAPSRGLVLIVGLSFLMGIQNAVVTRISDARVRTTHVSGMATDIGIELVMLVDAVRGYEPKAVVPLYQSKLRLHGQTLLSFLAGGIVGVLVYQVIGTALLFVAGGVLLAMGLTGIVRVRGLRNAVATPLV
jgi:uncharacterized membrane protein YoaK (UPF0700 family)